MAIDTPARLAIIGAGPIGIEAALYARFLGYEVELFEQGRVAEHVLRHGAARWYTPARELVSPLGIAALRGQDPHWQPPADDTLATGHDWVERYWRPLAESDLVVDQLRLHTTVVAVGRPHLTKSDLPGDPGRGDEDFLLLTRSATGQERLVTADAVLDCSGVMSTHRWAGPGGLPAAGELRLAERFEYGLLDPTADSTATKYAGRRVLLIGGGLTAAHNALALAQLDPRPLVTWITRREPLASSPGPIERVDHDPYPERDRLAQAANQLATSGASGLMYHAGTQLAAVTLTADGQLRCELLNHHGDTSEVDWVVASVGYRPDHTLASELQLDWCPASEALPQVEQSVLTTEPNYYLLGAKSFGRARHVRVSDGLRQIRAAFAIIGDRADLDLYRSIQS